MNNELIPGILEKDWNAIEQKLEQIRPFARTVHIDLLDGKFADNTSFADPAPFKKYSDYFYFELHMMVDNPAQYVQKWADAGFKRFIGHVEKMPDPVKFVADTQLIGEVGLAIDGKTKIEAVDINFEDLDCLLIMTINAGFSGQKFMPELLEKVKQIRAKNDLLPIEVDGGIATDTIKQALDAGTNRFVVNSALFNAENVKDQFHLLQKEIAGIHL